MKARGRAICGIEGQTDAKEELTTTRSPNVCVGGD